LFVAADERIVAHEIAGRDEQQVLALNPHPLQAITLSPDGRLLACGTCYRPDPAWVEFSWETAVWEMATGRRCGWHAGTLGGVWHRLDFCSLAFHPRRTALVSANRVGTGLWDPADPDPRSGLPGNDTDLVRFAEDGK